MKTESDLRPQIESPIPPSRVVHFALLSHGLMKQLVLHSCIYSISLVDLIRLIGSIYVRKSQVSVIPAKICPMKKNMPGIVKIAYFRR